jgi:ABC-2 type transport system permease protein
VVGWETVLVSLATLATGTVLERATSIDRNISLAIGFLIASLASTVELAIGINNILFFLMIAMGGVFFSTENLPEWAQIFTGLFPLTHFIEALRGIFNDGQSLFFYTKELLILTAWTLICFGLSLKYFRWY